MASIGGRCRSSAGFPTRPRPRATLVGALLLHRRRGPASVTRASWAPAAPQPPSPLGIQDGCSAEGGLPGAERVDAVGARGPAGHGVVPRWKLHRGHGGDTVVLGYAAGASAVSSSSPSTTGSARWGSSTCRRWLPTAGPMPRIVGLLDQQAALALGQGEHRRVRGRSRPDHRLRRVGRSDEHRPPPGHARIGGPVRSCRHAERRARPHPVARAVRRRRRAARGPPGWPRSVARRARPSRSWPHRSKPRPRSPDRCPSCPPPTVASSRPTRSAPSASGVAADVPVVIGTTRDEMRLFTTFDPRDGVGRAGRARSAGSSDSLDRHGCDGRIPTEVLETYRRRLGCSRRARRHRGARR